MQQKQMNRTALIDGDMVCYLIAVNKKQTDEQIEQYGNQEERTLEDCQKELDRYLFNILNVTESDYFIGFLTARSFRYDIYPEYKANRKKSESPVHLHNLIKYVQDKYGFVKVEGYEADDLLATYQTFAKDRTILISTDKDMLQLEGKHYNPRQNVTTVIDEFQANYNLWRQVLICDPVDNIKKSFRFGPKSVEKLFEGVGSHNYMHHAQNVYIHHLGLKKGLNEFNLNFNLIYLVREKELFDEALLTKYNVKDFFQESLEFKKQYDLLDEIEKNSDREREQSNHTNKTI